MGLRGVGENDMISPELRERLKKVLKNPASLIIFPNYRDHDRNMKYNLSALARWTGSTPSKKRIYTDRDRAFVFARHVTFHDIMDCNPDSQRARILNSYALARQNRTIAPFYALSYYMEYGNTSFWTASHLKDSITDKYFMHNVSMYVMMNAQTRRPQSVLNDIKSSCEESWNSKYPQNMKIKYKALKQTLSKNMGILNELNKNVEYRNKKAIYSYPIQLRYLDEDVNHHLNTNIYIAFVVETLNNYDQGLRQNKKVVYSMSNLYWKEIRMTHFEFCYVNIWVFLYFF